MSVAAAISAAGALAGTLASNISTGKLNKKNRKWQETMWNKTNEYNSPQAQMQRFKEAGLNPHLIYGGGASSGNTSMPSAPQQTPMDFSGLGDVAQNYIAMRKQQTEVNNMEKAEQKMDAEMTNISADTAKKAGETAKTAFEVQQAERLKDLTYATAEANLKNQLTQGKKMSKEIDQITSNMGLNQQQILKLKQDVAESMDRMKTASTERDWKRADTELKNIEASFRRRGINPNASGVEKLIQSLLNETGITEPINSSKNPINKNLPQTVDWIKKRGWTGAMYDWFTK